MRFRTVLATATFAAASAARLAAQCPDGTPPPCRGGTSAGAVARRPSPPLDARTWIILPFENVARAQDIDWLQDASVNLLYLDMSKWRDIRVVDDERVADLMREVPEARAALTLQSGMAVARRAGAGHLVMGDLLRIGSRTRVVAKIYDVRSGQRLRNVIEETANLDSLMPAFGRLARGILAADPPAGTALGTIGTGSLEAYRAYVSGVTALNRVDLDSAEAAFNRAIGFDSTFALAHYKVSVVYGWINPASRRRVVHAEAANRLSAGLPPRERQLILGQQQTSNGRWGDACQTYAALLRADSSDVEAWYNLGECNFHDVLVRSVEGDSARPAFRGSWNTALRAFQRALEFDPTYHLAYSHLPDILLVETRQGCRGREAFDNCPPADQLLAHTLRDGDTLVTAPISALAPDALARQAAEAVRRGVWRTNLQQNRSFAQAWVNSGPDEPRAHLALARALLRSGLPREAAREFELAPAAQPGTTDGNRVVIDRVELLVKLDSLSAVARLLDSLAARQRSGSQDIATFTPIALGRWGHIEEIFGTNLQAPPQVRRYLIAVMKTMQGAPPADLVALELGLDTIFASAPEEVRRNGLSTFLMATVPWTLGLERPASLRLDTASAEPRNRLVAQIVRRDTAGARATLARMDSIALAAPRELPTALTLQWSAEAHLWLGDTATALARLLEFEARLVFLNPASAYIAQFGNLTINVQSWGRTFLRLADAAAAQGDRATATRNYRRVVALWSSADAAFQSAVQRAREALARLGS